MSYFGLSVAAATGLGYVGGPWLSAVYLVLAWLAVSAVGAWATLHPPTIPVRRRCLPVGFEPREIHFWAADGTPLAGWHFSTAQVAAIGVVILGHGAFENRLGVIDCLPQLNALGWEVVSFDFRARGQSGGTHSTIGWYEGDDYVAAAAWAREQRPGLPVVLLGYSQGASAALLAGARDPQIDGLIADSPYDRLDRALDRHLRTFFWIASPVLGAPARWLIARGLGVPLPEVSPLAAAPRLAGRQVLLIHGSRDFMCEPAGAERIAAAIGPSVEFWMVPGARHTRARRRLPQEYWQRVAAFLERVAATRAA
ncbi:MAG: alpha/beta hydrolase [Fimbriimonadaceae bacterium]|nr:alpha/beta hydrolase [Fimbriimonadaceae bacterium]